MFNRNKSLYTRTRNIPVDKSRSTLPQQLDYGRPLRMLCVQGEQDVASAAMAKRDAHTEFQDAVQLVASSASDDGGHGPDVKDALVEVGSEARQLGEQRAEDVALGVMGQRVFARAASHALLNDRLVHYFRRVSRPNGGVQRARGVNLPNGLPQDRGGVDNANGGAG